MNDLTLAVYCVLGLVVIILGLVLPYFIYLTRCDIREIKEALRELKNAAAPAPDKEKSKWQKVGFKKIK